MSDEQVLYHNDEFNVTVTEKRLILRDRVYPISDLKHAGMANQNGCKDYAGAILFSVIGLVCLLQFNGWSILGLILLINPVLVFFVKRKFWVFIFDMSGENIKDESGGSSRLYTYEVAKALTDAINLAVAADREENDPRKGLNLG